MLRNIKIIALCLVIVLPLGCATMPPPASTVAYPEMVFEGIPGIWVSANSQLDGENPGEGSFDYEALGPFPIHMDELPVQSVEPDLAGLIRKTDVGRIESQISDEMADRLREEALLIPPSFGVIGPNSGDPALSSPALGASFESLDANDCCGGGLNVPPDPELAVGPNHIIAVVNAAIEVYDKSGNVLLGPTTFDSFFSGVANCDGNFDPNVLYDEEYDRFIIGIDADFDTYCVAATTGPNPLNTWNRYSFATNAGGLAFDYPHAGVGIDAIYLGANMFGTGFVEGRLWAMDKVAMYSGATMSLVTHSTGGEGTPQPMNLHGFFQGTLPTSGPHYILTDGPFNGADYGVWSWEDPFGTDVLTNKGSVDLNDFTGATAAFPIDVPQSGSDILLQANDWRVQDAEFRNGLIWMANTQACNPGAGTVDCVRWASIDPTGTPVVIDAGIYGSDGEYRFFADVAANDCDDLVIGYSKSSPSMFPSVWVTGRESGDDPGTLRAEVEVKAGERDYDSFQSGAAHRWGDYTGMTVDPDGKTFWYLGQYSKDIDNFNTTTWATFIGSFTLPSCDPPPPLPGQAHSPLPASGEVDILIDSLPMGWEPGAFATSRDVYFGVNPDPGVEEFQGNQTDIGFSSGEMEYETTYYWRIDEVNDAGTTPGAVWNFTTESEPPSDTVHIASLEGLARLTRDNWRARVVIAVENAEGLPVDGVLVEGEWSNGASGSGSCTTDDSGRCSVQKRRLDFGVSSVRFTVNNLSRLDFTYDPGANEDGNGGAISVYQIGTNQLPDAVDDDFDTKADEVVNGNVLVNDDLGDTPTTVTGFDASSVEGGTVDVAADGALTYTPPAAYDGSDSFGYTLTDNDGDTDSATVNVTITPDPNKLPDAVDDNFDTLVDMALIGHVLDNDNLGDTPTAVTGFDASSVEGGTVDVTADGTLTYTPPAAYDGSDSFGYTITDNDGDMDSATVYITINTDLDLLPDAVDDDFETTVDVVVNENVLGNDDLGDTPTTVTAFDASSVEGGTVDVAADGTLSYTPPAGYDGSDSFGYTITDNDDDTDSATVYITINPDVVEFTLTATPYIPRRRRVVDLEWSRVESAMVEVYRDDRLLYTIPNTGARTDTIRNNGNSDSYEYMVCEVEPVGDCATAIADFDGVLP